MSREITYIELVIDYLQRLHEADRIKFTEFGTRNGMLDIHVYVRSQSEMHERNLASLLEA